MQIVYKDTFFIFKDQLYAQHECCSMGSPNAPILINIFLAFKQSQWLQDCPPKYKPLHYKRLVDDTFVIFNNRELSQQFLYYLNRQHPNIKFTCEIQQDSALPFLDRNVKSEGSRLSTSIFRKKTLSGLGLNFFSFISFQFRTTAVKTAFPGLASVVGLPIIGRGDRIFEKFFYCQWLFQFFI